MKHRKHADRCFSAEVAQVGSYAKAKPRRGQRRGLLTTLTFAGLRIQEAPSLTTFDLDE